MQVIIKPKPDKSKMTLTQLFDYIDQLEAENARLEEAYQKATGEIAAEPIGVKVGKWAGAVCTYCGYSDCEYYDHQYCPNCGSKNELI